MIEGKDALLKKITVISNCGSSERVCKIVDRASKTYVQSDAKLNCPVNEGELRDSIKTLTKPTSNGCESATYTSKAHGIYVEFGTGPVGQKNHEGVSPDVAVAYSQHGWAIPADKVNPADAEKYKWPKRTYGGKEFYVTSGQPATPFLYPALKNNEQRVSQKIKSDLSKEIKKVKK